MTSQPKVSVLVPVFNAEKYLAECLDSILAQDFADYELLISDDCSTDGSTKIIETFAAKDARIRWWRNPVNLKQAANLNLCLRAARGEFIKFVFADDTLTATSALRLMVQALDADAGIALVGSASHITTSQSRVILTRNHFQKNCRVNGLELTKKCLEDPVTLSPINLIGEPTVTLFRRRQAGRGFDERFRSLLDLELWFHLLEQGDFAYLAEPLSAFRRHGAQETLVNRRSGASARDAIRLAKIYYTPARMGRRKLFQLIHRSRKNTDPDVMDLSASLQQQLGPGWRFFYFVRQRTRRLLQNLQFWRRRRLIAGKTFPEKWHPAPTVPGRNDHPLVSVLVPVYNGEKYLAECLDSILAQDFTEMEILIADDGSTDGSRELIERYAAKDRRIRWWRNPVNLGLAGNFNSCLQAARHDYIKYVLQDDKLLSPSVIRQMVQALDADPAVSLVGSASYVINARSERIELRNVFRRSGVMDGKAAILHCLKGDGNFIGEPSVVMFRREQAGRGYNEHYRQLIDLEFWFHLLEQGRFAYLAEPLCAFRQHPQQQTAFNRQARAHEQDELMLAQTWLMRPWMREIGGRQVLFEQIYNLRKRYGKRAQPFIGDALAGFTVPWYGLYWLRYKINRPFKNLRRSLQKRRGRQPEPGATAANV